MKLIVEQSDFDVEYVTEGSGSEKRSFIEGVFMQANRLNKNKRKYSRKVLEGSVGKYVTEQVGTNRAVGELGHPSSPTINLDKVSHRITNLRWDGDNVVGKALLLETPMGKIAQSLQAGGVKLGVSSRGMGTLLKREDYTDVQPDFVICAVDIVQDPSAPEAFVNGIMENTEWFYDNGILSARQIDEYQDRIHSTNSKLLTEAQLSIWSDFVSKLSSKG